MGDFSRVIVTIHPDDDDRFWEVVESQKPGRFCQWDATYGATTYDIEQARGGWEDRLKAAAEAGLRFYGEDTGCVGVWTAQLFAAIDGRIAACPAADEIGPVAYVKDDGTVSEEDVKLAVDYYAAYKAVDEAMEESFHEVGEDWREHLKPGDEVTWNDPDDGKCSGVYKVTSIEEAGPSGPIYHLRNEEGSEVDAFEHELS